jgi:peptidoglycan/LPS O-acetylase OafA/YrhL
MIGFVGLSVAVWLMIGNYALPTGHLVPLALGCWAACWSIQERGTSRLTPALRDNRLALVCVAIFAAALLVNPPGVKGQALALLVAVAATALLLHCTLNADSFVSRVLASPVPRWIGVRSYGIYLYGLTLLILVPAVTHLQFHLALPLDVVVIVVVVSLSYRFAETPFRARGRAWLGRRGEVESSDAELGLSAMADNDGDPA